MVQTAEHWTVKSFLISKKVLGWYLKFNANVTKKRSIDSAPKRELYFYVALFFTYTSLFSSAFHGTEEALPVISQAHIPAGDSETQQERGLFQSFANMSDFSFTAMAAASSGSKHAFGSRRDDAVMIG